MERLGGESVRIYFLVGISTNGNSMVFSSLPFFCARML
jgi:hypothetical protein